MRMFKFITSKFGIYSAVGLLTVFVDTFADGLKVTGDPGDSSLISYKERL